MSSTVRPTPLSPVPCKTTHIPTPSVQAVGFFRGPLDVLNRQLAWPSHPVNFGGVGRSGVGYKLVTVKGTPHIDPLLSFFVVLQQVEAGLIKFEDFVNIITLPWSEEI